MGTEYYVKVPETGIGDLSDGYHTFNQLYFQRMVLFATLVGKFKDRSWKSYRHEDGYKCFDGEYFIVGIDTPEGSYTYHYKNEYWDWFDCEELEVAKHWDGHTEEDVTRLLSLLKGETITEDVVKVIRCKDCEYWSYEAPPGLYFCMAKYHLGHPINKDLMGFCSDAKKRKKDEEKEGE